MLGMASPPTPRISGLSGHSSVNAMGELVNGVGSVMRKGLGRTTPTRSLGEESPEYVRPHPELGRHMARGSCSASSPAAVRLSFINADSSTTRSRKPCATASVGLYI